MPLPDKVKRKRCDRDSASASDESFSENKETKFRKEGPTSIDKNSEKMAGNEEIIQMMKTLKAEICADINSTIDNKLDTLATKEDLQGIRFDLEKTCQSMTRKIELLENEMFDSQAKHDGHTNAIEGLKNQNAILQEQIEHQAYAHEELIQYNRKSNIKIYNLPEEMGTGGRGETAQETVRAVVKLCREELGCDISEKDISTAHRLQKTNERKERSIIVKFVRRSDRNMVIRHRRALKGKSVVIADDLSPFFMKMFFEFKDVVGQNNVWSVEGQIFVKIKGRISRVGRDNRGQLMREARQWQAEGGDTNFDSDNYTPSQNVGHASMHESSQGNTALRGFGRGSPTGGASAPPDARGGRDGGRGGGSPNGQRGAWRGRGSPRGRARGQSLRY